VLLLVEKRFPKSPKPEGLRQSPLGGALGLPLYRPREGPGVHVRERGKEEREKNQEKGCPGAMPSSSSSRRALLVL
jgi:hypothetical protein